MYNWIKKFKNILVMKRPRKHLHAHLSVLSYDVYSVAIARAKTSKFCATVVVLALSFTCISRKKSNLENL